MNLTKMIPGMITEKNGPVRAVYCIYDVYILWSGFGPFHIA